LVLEGLCGLATLFLMSEGLAVVKVCFLFLKTTSAFKYRVYSFFLTLSREHPQNGINSEKEKASLDILPLLAF